MRVASRADPLAVFAVTVALSGCDSGRPPANAVVASPSAAAAAEQGDRLSAQDLRVYVAVRGKALQRLEDALAAVEPVPVDVLARVKELGATEREAAASLGVEWRTYARVRDRLATLLAARRQREDRRLLAAELARAEQELTAQLAEARDPASRQFLQAQVTSLGQQISRLQKDQSLSKPDLDELAVVESSRAEIALLQGRYEKVQRRLQELLARGTPPPAPQQPTGS